MTARIILQPIIGPQRWGMRPMVNATGMNARRSAAELSALPAIVVFAGGGGGGSEQYLRFVQSSALTPWTVNHNFGRFPVVAIATLGGVEVEADVRHVSINQFQVHFNAAQTGQAIVR